MLLNRLVSKYSSHIILMLDVLNFPNVMRSSASAENTLHAGKQQILSRLIKRFYLLVLSLAICTGFN